MFCIWCGLLVLWVICRCLGLLVVDLFVAFGLLLLFDSAGLGLLGFFGELLQYVGLFWFISSSWWVVVVGYSGLLLLICALLGALYCVCVCLRLVSGWLVGVGLWFVVFYDGLRGLADLVAWFRWCVDYWFGGL